MGTMNMLEFKKEIERFLTTATAKTTVRSVRAYMKKQSVHPTQHTMMYT